MRMPDAGIRLAGALFLGAGLFCSTFVVGAVATSQAVPRSEQQSRQLIHSVGGSDLFRAYCAPCHGSDAKGHGPAARALKAKVPDLTVLTRDNSGQFPSIRVSRVIMGEDVVASHGSREMPIWGPIFHQIESDVDKGNVRLENLVKYLEAIQSIPAR